MIADDAPTLTLVIDGPRRPGNINSILQCIKDLDVEIVDMAGGYVRDRLRLTMLLASPFTDLTTVKQRVEQLGEWLGLRVDATFGLGDNSPHAGSRVAVTVMAPRLTAHELAPVTETIAHLDGMIDRAHRVSRDRVTTLELSVSGADVDLLRTRLHQVAATSWVDIAVAPEGFGRRGQRMVVMDVDSTLIQQEVIELLADHAGSREEVADVTARSMRGELDFEASLRARVATLAGLPESVFDDVLDEVRLTPGAQEFVATIHRIGYPIALVSGGFEEVVGPLAARLGITRFQANHLEVSDGRLTGQVVGTVVTRAEKARALRRFADAERLDPSRVIAIGDGANDLDMLAAAGVGVAFNGKPIVREQADVAVNVPYLDSVLSLLGIDLDEA